MTIWLRDLSTKLSRPGIGSIRLHPLSFVLTPISDANGTLQARSSHSGHKLGVVSVDVDANGTRVYFPQRRRSILHSHGIERHGQSASLVGY